MPQRASRSIAMIRRRSAQIPGPGGQWILLGTAYFPSGGVAAAFLGTGEDGDKIKIWGDWQRRLLRSDDGGGG